MFYKVLGLMSGTSLDGLDLAYCEFELLNGKWHYCIRQAETVEYSVELKNKILACEESSGEYLAFMDSYLGSYFGKQARIFLDKYNLELDFISSHGQTVFHRPEKNFTLQIGNINSLCAESRCSVIGDFRSLDVALQGQGAPLVPIGDKELFSDYDCCLNLGGFSNTSFQEG
ncbi:MAG: anhydro-N-acetylmuramic acid kinase, partial [Bacteroidales bacterium]|nr:anhydro-N-acetylmuramic acid kinase [Bacteroidales bacterium]